MTEKLIRNEQEAIECLKKNKPTSGYYMLQESVEMAIQALEEIQKYRAIGTIEEFMALKEKNEPKKIAHQGCYDADGVLHIWNGVNGVPYDLCPNCEINLCTDGMFGGNKNGMKYCKNCGQKLDWSE